MRVLERVLLGLMALVLTVWCILYTNKVRVLEEELTKNVAACIEHCDDYNNDQIEKLIGIIEDCK